MKLNLGCGQTEIPGYLGVDFLDGPATARVVDLEQFPWPWADNSVDAIIAYHSLEHMGERKETFLRIVQEIYRVCKDGALVDIKLPDPRGEGWYIDPTHVRPITLGTWTSFDASWNLLRRELGSGNQNLAWSQMVDFEIVAASHKIDARYQQIPERFLDLVLCVPGAIQETRIVSVVRKPVRTVPYQSDKLLKATIEFGSSQV